MKDRQSIEFSLDGTIAARDTCRQTGWRTRYLYAFGNLHEHEMKITASATWSPEFSNPQSDDNRLLSVLVRTPLMAVDLSNRGFASGLYWDEPAPDIPAGLRE